MSKTLEKLLAVLAGIVGLVSLGLTFWLPWPGTYPLSHFFLLLLGLGLLPMTLEGLWPGGYRRLRAWPWPVHLAIALLLGLLVVGDEVVRLRASPHPPSDPRFYLVDVGFLVLADLGPVLLWMKVWFEKGSSDGAAAAGPNGTEEVGP